MLSNASPVATLPTRDLARARVFYEQTLGLTAANEDPGGVRYTCGDGRIYVYQSAFAGTNKATALSLTVSDAEFDTAVSDLRAKGIDFQTFELDGLEWVDGVAMVGPSMRAVWFGDPDGNVINLSAGSM